MKYDSDIVIDVPECVYPPCDDSMLLIKSLNIRKDEKILEIGCGSGVVSIHCAKNGGIVTAVDINPYAVECTKRNAEDNSVKMDVKVSDLYANVQGKYDTIIFNLPYLPVDEKGLLAKSWSGGDDGIGPLPKLISGSKNHLNENGRIVIVTSSLMNQEKLNEILSEHKVKTMGESPLFFEKLKVLEIIP